MEIGIEKCAFLMMENGKRKTAEGIKQQNQKSIKMFGKKENYEYLGILVINTIKQAGMKRKMRKDYIKRIKRHLETNPCNRNLIKRINTWTGSL